MAMSKPWVSLAKKKGGDGSAGELFSRATVVSDPLAAPKGSAVRATAGGGGGKRRVHVRYPQGSSYRVRRRMLAPILPPLSDPSEGGGMVVVASHVTNAIWMQRVVLEIMGQLETV